MSSSPITHVRTSERRALKRCPQQWEWSYRDGLKPREEAMALWFGSGIHIALAHYYGPGRKRRLDYIDLWDDYAKTADASVKADDKLIDAKELGRTMLIGYHERWGGDPDWDVVATEQAFQVRIPTLNGEEFIEYDGTMDGVYRSRSEKRFRLMEHKTAASVSLKHLALDDQAGSYWAVAHTVLRHAGILRPKQNIDGITYNFLRKGQPDDRPKNADGMALNMDGSVSKRQSPPLFVRDHVKRTPRERATQINRIKAEAALMDRYASGDLPIIKAPGDHCSWCPFMNMCELHEQGADWTSFRDAMYVVTDPYADHRKVA